MDCAYGLDVIETTPFFPDRLVKASGIGDNAVCPGFCPEPHIHCKNYEMMRRRVTYQSTAAAWVALFALLLQALLPNVMYAHAADHRVFAEICTAGGVKKVAVGEPVSSAADDMGSHCLACAVADPPALPGNDVSFRAQSSPAFDPPISRSSLEARLSRATLHVRGPPRRA